MPSSRGNSSNHDNGGQASNSGTLSLERKLELLESRFTQPALPSLDRANASNPWSNSAFGNTNTGTPSKDTGRMSPTSNHSQHSFRFPSINSNESSNPLPHSSVRSRKRPTLNASFHSVSMAAARHIRKVAATSPVLGMSASNFSNTNSSSSNQTLLTSHVQQNPPQPAQRIVAESPPVIVSPHMHQQLANQNGPPKPKVARNILPSSTSAKGNIKPTAVDKTNNNDGTPGKNTNMVGQNAGEKKNCSICLWSLLYSLSISYVLYRNANLSPSENNLRFWTSLSRPMKMFQIKIQQIVIWRNRRHNRLEKRLVWKMRLHGLHDGVRRVPFQNCLEIEAIHPKPNAQLNHQPITEEFMTFLQSLPTRIPNKGKPATKVESTNNPPL